MQEWDCGRSARAISSIYPNEDPTGFQLCRRFHINTSGRIAVNDEVDEINGYLQVIYNFDGCRF